MTAAEPLWRRLFDDAALFPPGNAAFADAVPAYVERAGTGLGGYVGPFIAPVARWAEFHAALPGPVDLSAICGVATLPELLDLVAAEPRVFLRSVEVPPGGDVAASATALGRLLPPRVTGYFEVPLGPDFPDAARAVLAAGQRIKIRTGGTTAEAFPTEPALAEALATCVRLSLPFKLTAGLHNAVRHRDGRTGFEHHGFVNVVAAVAVALADEPDPAALAGILADTDGARLAARVATMPADLVDRVRDLFTSFGTCSIEEPYADLVALGLVRSVAPERRAEA